MCLKRSGNLSGYIHLKTLIRDASIPQPVSYSGFIGNGFDQTLEDSQLVLRKAVLVAFLSQNWPESNQKVVSLWKQLARAMFLWKLMNALGENIFHANSITKEPLALCLQCLLKLVSTNGIFLSFPILVDWFFIEYLKIAALKFFCGKKMIIGVRVLMKKTEEPSFSKKNCGNCCRCFWFEIGIARKQWCSILKAYWQSPEKTRFLQLISFIRFYEWLGKLTTFFYFYKGFLFASEMSAIKWHCSSKW